MTKWEYATLILYDGGLKQLNEVGEKGWELVTVNWEASMAYLKRQKPDKPFGITRIYKETEDA